jgi:hypothetical protein
MSPASMIIVSEPVGLIAPSVLMLIKHLRIVVTVHFQPPAFQPIELLMIGQTNGDYDDKNNNEISNPQRKFHPIIMKTITALVHAELSKASKTSSNEALGECLQTLLFLERAAVYINPTKVGAAVMEFLTTILRVDASSTSSMNDFVTIKVKKVRENNPKIMVICSLLTIAEVIVDDPLPTFR